MIRRRAGRPAILLAGALLGAFGVISHAARAAPSAPQLQLPGALSDAEFWRLVDTFSEPNGYFNSDNLLSNETTFQSVIPALKQTVRPGGVYVGVGPEQNFTYIIALEPAIAFIPDIRRGNLQEHLMYKALFEMASDRAEFLSLLFSRKRPAGLGADASIEQLMAAYSGTSGSPELFRKNLAALKDWLSQHHTFHLEDGDLAGVEYVYSNFYAAGPSLSYNANGPGRRNRYPTYAELQVETDGRGQHRGYLASEQQFRAIKRYEERNLLVPIVGDFAGPKALRAVGQYARDRGAVVTTFYTSNVENYLFQSGSWERFAANVATMPVDETSTFIRACFDNCTRDPSSRSTTLLDSIPALLKDFRQGRVRTYWDVLGHSR